MILIRLQPLIRDLKEHCEFLLSVQLKALSSLCPFCQSVIIQLETVLKKKRRPKTKELLKDLFLLTGRKETGSFFFFKTD